MISELNRRGIRYKVDAKNINVWCPWHRGSYFKLKLGLHKSGKYGNCWVCGKGRGGWNAYAEEVGLTTIDFGDPNVKNDFTELSLEIDEFEKRETHQHSLPNGLQPWTGPWQRFGNGEDFDETFLRTLPSYEWYDSVSESYRILWPVEMNGVLKGWTAGRNDETSAPKYRNSDMMDTAHALFPFDHKVHFEKVGDEEDVPKQSIVLTEGPASSLRLVKEGLPASCVFGVKNWNEFKVAPILARGIKRVVLAFDGDEEGWACAQAAYKHLNRASMDVRVMDFPDNVDPANCSTKHVGLIKRMLK